MQLNEWLDSNYLQHGDTESFVVFQNWDASKNENYHVWLDVIVLDQDNFAVVDRCEINGITSSWQVVNAEGCREAFEAATEKYQHEQDLIDEGM